MNLLSTFILLIPLALVRASPTPQPTIPSIFNSDKVPVVNNLDLSSFNLTTLHSRGSLDGTLSKRALTLDYVLYTVTFDGATHNNAVPFLLTGALLLTSGIPSPATRNGANPIEVAIEIGNPYSSPTAGSIRYITNRYLSPLLGGSADASLVDYAYVTATETTVEVTVDGSLAAANTISGFNTRTGIGADVYNPAEGGFVLELGSDGSLQGKVQFVGRGVISGAVGSYAASVTGSAAQMGSATF